MGAVHPVSASLASRFGTRETVTPDRVSRKPHPVERRVSERRSFLRAGGRRATDRRVTAPPRSAASTSVATAAVIVQTMAPVIGRTGQYTPQVRTFAPGSLFDRRL
jgi:hypothetical protein